jgi:hypothetical protein
MEYLSRILKKVSSQHTFIMISLPSNMLMILSGRTHFVNNPTWYLIGNLKNVSVVNTLTWSLPTKALLREVSTAYTVPDTRHLELDREDNKEPQPRSLGV